MALLGVIRIFKILCFFVGSVCLLLAKLCSHSLIPQNKCLVHNLFHYIPFFTVFFQEPSVHTSIVDVGNSELYQYFLGRWIRCVTQILNGRG